jgi:hypothetical protein
MRETAHTAEDPADLEVDQASGRRVPGGDELSSVPEPR